jgi:hypothetical protein
MTYVNIMILLDILITWTYGEAAEDQDSLEIQSIPAGLPDAVAAGARPCPTVVSLSG